MTHFYKAYGLIIATPFPCPVLPPAPETAFPDISVVEGEVPYELAAPLAEDPAHRWQVAQDRYLFRAGQRAGRFLAEAGSRVTLQRNPQAEESMLAFFFLDTVLAALLQQRGMLVLHANAAVLPSGSAVAVSGVSGAGKSTTLAALLQRGCSMLSDDITALQLNDGLVTALPGIPQLHLTEDSAAGLGADISALPRYAWRRMKAAVPTQAAMSASPAPLQALYLIRTHPGDDLIVELLSGVAGFDALLGCVFGPLLPQDHPTRFPLFAAVTAQVHIYGIQRPAKRWSVNELVEKILNPGIL